MKVSKARVVENHERILEGAGRLFRERGFDGVGVAELMAAAGLTSGAFYGHFASKDDLVARTCERVLTTQSDPWAQAPLDGATDSYARFVDTYLSPAHLDRRNGGCLYATLGGEVARQSPSVRRAFTRSFKARLDAFSGAVFGRSQQAKREKALAAMSAMVGALMLARAVDDPELAGEILGATRASLT